MNFVNIIVIIDYLHILFHGNFVESEDVKKKTTSSHYGPHSVFVSIIVIIYSSKTISIRLHLSIYSVQSTQYTMYLDNFEVEYFFLYRISWEEVFLTFIFQT